ncbi:MAG TPA: extracellular solute-binding protein [Parcubacteria group bacterium]|nr:extracellular solute-binding protein [Parcubacteria group bacterium]
MNGNTSKFKLGVMIFFGVFIVIGILVFALAKNSSSSMNANLTIWGTLSRDSFELLLKNSSIANSKTTTVTYVLKDQGDFDQELIEALAEGKGPDIVMLRDDNVYKHRNRLFVIPYKSYPERAFKDKFIEGSEVFLSKEGVTAVPFMTDPMVMYWNRNIFTNNLVSQPPQYWDQVFELTEKMTKRDANGNVLQSTIALGESRNISNSKEILATLLLQAGTPIVQRNNDGAVSVLANKLNQPVAPSESALNFYTQFSNPVSKYYTWNRSLPSSLNMFLGGNLAMYIGFASEIFSIQQKNSNLNFDVTYVPQTRNTENRTVFGHMYAFAITKQSKNIAAAYGVINTFTEPAPLKSLETATNLPPIRRDMLADKPTDAFRSVFYNSALISESWIDPEPTVSTQIFRDMVENVTSGRSRVLESIGRADTELNQELK